jgi:transcriptional regulator with XRE-family HTH domain
MSEKSIGAKVRSEREAIGQSREQLAYRAGVSTSTMLRLENLDRIPKTVTFKRIADELGTTVDALLSPTPQKRAAHRPVDSPIG